MEQSTELATGGGEALDAEELMGFSERIERLSPADAEWVTRLFDECLRARMHEAELLAESFRERVTRTEDALEGPRAFVEKRAPNWQAR